MSFYIYSNRCPKIVSPNPEPCDDDTEALLSTNEHCGLILDDSGVFESCIAANPTVAQTFFESCAFDGCSNQDDMKTTTCKSVEVFATHCANKGYRVSWREAADCRKWS